MFLRRVLRILSRPGIPVRQKQNFSFNRKAQSLLDKQILHILRTEPGQYNAGSVTMEKKRKYDFKSKSNETLSTKPRSPASFSKKPKKAVLLPEGSGKEVLDIEIAQLLAKVSLKPSIKDDEAAIDNSESKASELKSPTAYKRPSEIRTEIELEIVQLSSTGDGLAYNDAKDHVFVVPFAVPGDRVLAKPWSWQGAYTVADFIKVIRPSLDRDGVVPRCKYFAQCSGCQFQMLPYEYQLEHKRGIVQNAFKHFSGLRADQIPDVGRTGDSPLQYGYRTKLSPHFGAPRKQGKLKPEYTEVPSIGFNISGTRKVLDIESCPIGTEILQEGLRIEREKVAKNLKKYTNGATILLRESTQRTYPGHAGKIHGDSETMGSHLTLPQNLPSDTTQLPLQSSVLSYDVSTGAPHITRSYPTHTDVKTYTSDATAQATEYITTTTDLGNATANPPCPPTTHTYQFTNSAGSFFQNNNSILGLFTSYIYGRCVSHNSDPTKPQIKYLLDAYSGSGLFTLTLSSHFRSSLGIDIDNRSIDAARSNALANNISSAGFIDADAAAIFADVPYPSDETVVVIDPPRKGCDYNFLKQLRLFGPRRVVYVSCNVHTQARDIGVLVNGFARLKQSGAEGWKMEKVGDQVVFDEDWEEMELWKYEIESIRGFDFFPQTGHVEGVCVLNRVEK